MSKDNCGMTRRDFLMGTTGAALAGALAVPLPCREARAAKATLSRVVLVRDRNALDGRRANPKVVARMLDEGVSVLLGARHPSVAWSSLVSADDTVGIKSNVWRFLPTPPELEDALVERMRGAGVPRRRISVDDRGVLANRIFRESTALINVRPMRTHHWAGVGSCIKNYIMFSHNPPSWHDDSCSDLGGLWELPVVRGRTRINILVMLTPLFHGKGPHHYNPKYTWDYQGLIVGTDPVAVDTTGLRILQAKRRAHFGSDEPFAVSPKHIKVAAEKYGLGVADPARIEVEVVGWKDGLLI
jgi:hypothetical protein